LTFLLLRGPWPFFGLGSITRHFLLRESLKPFAIKTIANSDDPFLIYPLREETIGRKHPLIIYKIFCV